MQTVVCSKTLEANRKKLHHVFEATINILGSFLGANDDWKHWHFFKPKVA